MSEWINVTLLVYIWETLLLMFAICLVESKFGPGSKFVRTVVHVKYMI